MPAGAVTSSDDWETGTIAAACGGTTTVIDFVEPEAVGAGIVRVGAEVTSTSYARLPSPRVALKPRAAPSSTSVCT